MARTSSSKGRQPKTEKPLAEKRLLDRLTPDEANAVLHGLLKNHPELKPEPEIGQRRYGPTGNRCGGFSVFNVFFAPFCGQSSGAAGRLARFTIRPTGAKVLLLCQRHLRNEVAK